MINVYVCGFSRNIYFPVHEITFYFNYIIVKGGRFQIAVASAIAKLLYNYM